MKPVITFLAIGLVWVFGNEPSAFKAGKIEDKDPYGLTQEEQYILDNKRSIGRLSKSLDSLSGKVDAMSKIVLDNNARLSQDLLRIQEDFRKSIASLESQAAEVALEAKNQSSESKKALDGYRDDLVEFKKVLTDLAALTKFINESYTSQEDFDRLSEDLNSLKNNQINQVKKVKSMSGYDLTKLGEKLMAENQYAKALPIYQELVKKNYRPARSHFNLGEIAFYSKDYSKALRLYKTSVGIYAKADYLPLLLLHSGEASSALGNNADAKKFFDSVVQRYPQSKEAQRAKKLLNR